MKNNSRSTGRLKQTLDPIAQAIVFPKQNESVLLNELAILAILNEAHLISLLKAKLLPLSTIKKLLKSIAALRKKKFTPLLRETAERGSYLLFENYLIETVGMDIAGSLHVGRSRNDINATTFKLTLRYFYKNIYHSLCELRTTLLQQAIQYKNIAMPIYSQFQVAQVGTYAYYLLAIEEAFSRDLYYLKELFYSLNECPIGAAAGCGTSFSIDRKLTASLLGFSRSCDNALDAVASRDLALRMFSAISILGTTLSRMAQDFQLWTTQEFAFFELPDSLCGGSSMMPQKKNPYLFEIIKGKSASLNGLLIQALTAMHNVPFSNSMEVGTEALQGMQTALKNACDILTLSELVVSKAVPIETQLINSINKGMAVATGVAEYLVKEKNVPFRQAHHEIGSKITQAVANQADPMDEILKLTGNALLNREPIFWAHLNENGGGPGKSATMDACQSAQKRLLKDTTWIDSVEMQWNEAERKLQSSVMKVIRKR